MLIHINGMPGVGKLTVARALAEQLDMHLVDNHSLINAAYAAGFARGSDGFLRSLSDITRIVYRGLAENSGVLHIIMTNCLAAGYSPDPERFAAVEQLALDRKEPFVPVLLTCSQDENMRRIVSFERKGRQKLVDAGLLASYYLSWTMIHPGSHPNQLALDTTHLSVEQTAAAIADHLHDHLSLPPAGPS